MAQGPTPDGVAGVVLAAGEGRRLRPLTRVLPKPLCPVANRPLVDHAVVAVRFACADVAVNVHHGRDAMETHLAGSGVHLSVEAERPLGTAGAIGRLSGWLGGRAALVVNADTVHDADLHEFVSGWDGERVRVLTATPGPFGPRSSVVASIVPAAAARRLTEEPSGLWEVLWREEAAAGRLDAVLHSGRVLDCGTPADYLAANLLLSGGAAVVGEGAVVEGIVERSVVWPGSHVGRHEHLVDAVRAGRLTVLVR